MKLFDESILPEIPKVKPINDKTIGIVVGVFVLIFFWYKYNQKQRRLLVEAEAKRNMAQESQKFDEQHQLQVLKRELELKDATNFLKEKKKSREPLPLPMGFSLSKF